MISVPLFSGIGNVIQSLPFIHWLKQFHEVTAFKSGLDFPETVTLLDGVIDIVYENIKRVPKTATIIKTPRRRSYPESKSWFVDNGIEPPENLNIPFINYAERSELHDIVIWPECKKNWPCKRWPHWQDLIDLLSVKYDVAVVGTETSDKYDNVTDYRGTMSLIETGGIVKNARMFFGNEGGISHYAAALGTKTYIIFGCTDPIKNLPPANAEIISKGLSCQPCQFNGLRQEGITMLGCDHRNCLQTLTANEIMEKLIL